MVRQGSLFAHLSHDLLNPRILLLGGRRGRVNPSGLNLQEGNSTAKFLKPKA